MSTVSPPTVPCQSTGEASASLDPKYFRRVLSQYPTGVVVITAVHEGEPVGMAVGSFTSVSLEPALVGFFPDRSSTTWPRIRAAGAFCVNVLGEHQQDVCRVFATRGADKFGQLTWAHGPTGAPRLDDALAWIDCELDRVDEVGDHFLVLGRVCELESGSTASPLVFFRGGYGGYREPAAA